MSEGRQFLLLLRVHLRMLRIKLMKLATGSRLMALTLILFLATYSFTAHRLFRQGLIYFAKLPAAGGLLVDRMIHIVFFCFLAMLMFSVAVSGYIALYRSRDTRWLLTLPLSHRVVFLWKIFESVAFSSWGLFLITAPLLLAFAELREVRPGFYIGAALGLAPFLTIAGSVAAMMLLGAVRWLKRRQLIAAGSLAVLLLAGWVVQTVRHEKMISQRVGFSPALTFQQVLRHTDISANRAFPSTWYAASIVEWSHPRRTVRPLLMPSLLVSWAAMGALATTWLARRWFYLSWNHSLQNAAIASLRRRPPVPAEIPGLIARNLRDPGPFSRWLGRGMAAVTWKDLVSFRREPAQWIQFLIVFGLLAVYATGLRRLNEHIDQPRDLYLVAFLNLAVCALALSTLTTRFVFPQFSLEGRRLWILAMSPLRLPRLVMQKFLLSTICTSLAVSAVVTISGHTLNLRTEDTVFFTVAMLLVSVGLNGMAVGFGVLFPNLEESNSARIVSGFGGTLCLVTSFVYIVSFLLLLAWARLEVFKNNALPNHWIDGERSLPGLGLAVLITTVLTAGPLFFAMKRLKRLEILGNL